jgi:hypothetical protein
MSSLPAAGRPERRFPNYAAWTNVVLGILVFLLRYASPRPSFEVHRNLFLTGIVVSIAALGSTIAYDGFATKNYWSLFEIVAGVWLIVSERIYPSPASMVTSGQVLLGAVIILFALVSLALERGTKPRAPGERGDTTAGESLSR